MREVASRIERALPLLGASTNEIKTLKNFIKSQSNYEIENVKIIIQKYAPFEFLTAGWGTFQEKRKKTKEQSSLLPGTSEDYVWAKISDKSNEEPLEKSYLIYKKGED